MQWFSALIPAYPDVQRKAQEELDLVVGRDRLPTVEDEKNLPYCHAIIKEVKLYCYYSIGVTFVCRSRGAIIHFGLGLLMLRSRTSFIKDS
jgi:hypothetical protein